MFLVFKNGNPPQLPLPATMTPKAITSALVAAQVLFLPIDGQPSDNNLLPLSDAISPILLKATYDRVNASTTYGALLPARIAFSTTMALPSYAQPSVRPVTTRRAMRKILALTVFAPKLPGLLYSKTTRPTRPLSAASRSSLRP